MTLLNSRICFQSKTPLSKEYLQNKSKDSVHPKLLIASSMFYRTNETKAALCQTELRLSQAITSSIDCSLNALPKKPPLNYFISSRTLHTNFKYTMEYTLLTGTPNFMLTLNIS